MKLRDSVQGKLTYKVDFHRHVIFTRINEIEAIYERSRVNVKVEPCSYFTLTSDLSCIASILFADVRFTHVRT